MAIDPTTGVYIFDGTEPDYPMVDTLNLLAQSTRDALTSLRSGDFLVTVINPSTFLTFESGWGWRNGFANVVRRTGSRIEFTLAFTKTSDIVHGDVVGTIAQQFAPIGSSEWPLAGVQSGTSLAAGIGAVVNSSRQITPFSPTASRRNLQVSGYFVTA